MRSTGMEFESSSKVLHERGLKRRIGEFVHAQGPEKRVLSDPLDQIFSANEDATLRTSQQFVSAGGNEVHAARKGPQQTGFSIDPETFERGKKAGALIFKQGMPARFERSTNSCQRWPLCKPFDTEIGLMHAEQQTGARSDCAFIVFHTRAVGSSDFL